MAREYTIKERLANWFYYNKIWVAVGAVILWVAGSMLWNALGIGQEKPDFCVAYVGGVQMPEDCVTAVEAALEELAPDANGDGTVVVTLIQYILPGTATVEDMRYSYAAQMSLLADITEGQSLLFLVEDPQEFQRAFQILAHLDGTIPDEEDYEGLDKVYAWGNCPVLADLDLGGYADSYLDITETGENQSLLSGLYLGRRYFYDKTQEPHPEENELLWQILTAGAEN